MIDSARSASGISLQVLLTKKLAKGTSSPSVDMTQLVALRYSLNKLIEQMIANSEIQVVETETVVDCEISVAYINNIDDRLDKNGNMMGFIILKIEGCQIRGLVFASKILQDSRHVRHTEIMTDGKKDDRGGSLITNS